MKSLNTLWNEEMAKVKVGDSDVFNNFYIHHRYSWNHLVVENQVWSCHFLKFKIWTIQILSNKKMIKIKVIDSDEFNKFYVHNFSSWNHLRFQNLVWSCHLLKFKISTIQILSNKKMIKIKVVDSDVFNNFYVHDFCSWNDLRFQHLVWSCYLLKFKIWTVQILSNEKMTKIKVVNSDVFNNFYIHHLYSWNHLVVEK